MAAFSEAALISKEVFVEIHVYQRQGMSLRKIAAEVGCAVNTVRRYLGRQQRAEIRAQGGAGYQTWPLQRLCTPATGCGTSALDPSYGAPA